MRIPLFDIDWTLLKGGNRIHGQAFAHAFLTVWNVPASADDINHQGMTDKQIYVEVLLRRGMSEDVALRSFPVAKEVMVEYYNTHQHEDESPPLPGVVNTLDRLVAAEIPRGLLTGNTREIALSKLQKAGLDRYFSFGAFGDLTARRAELVEVARTHYQRIHSRSGNFCIIGDAPRDIECAKQTGIPVVAVASGQYSKVELEKYSPDLALASLEETETLMSFLSR